MKKYMIALHGDMKAWSALSPDDMQRLLGLYNDWVKELRAKDVFEYGLPLSDRSRVISNDGVTVRDGPYIESKEVLTGFFVIRAASMEAAVLCAKSCPALLHGEHVEVIEVEDHG